jgi:hypothetical protein
MSGVDLNSLFTATEQKYNLPPGILRATAQVESSLRPDVVSQQGAEGLMQLEPDTAKSLGADPFNVPQAVDAAGKLWAQNLQASGGDIDRAAMMYHGGPDTSKWGPKTAAYPGKLAAALGPAQAPQPQPKGGDPIEAALEGQSDAQDNAPSAPADPGDPIESALSGQGTPSANDVQAANTEMLRMFRSGRPTAEIVAYGVQHGISPNPDQIDEARRTGRGIVFVRHDGQPDPNAPPPEPQTDQGLGFYQGVMRPFDNAAQWLQEGAAKIGLDKPINALGNALGLPTLQQANAGHQAYIQGQEAQGKVPGGLGEFAGEVAGTLPVVAVTKNPFLAGGLSGALTTKDPNNGKRILIDALLGAAGGKAAHAVTGAVSGLVAPAVSNAVRAMGDIGTQMSPGQLLGGAFRRMEDAATSFGPLGDIVKNAQRRSILSFNRGTINQRVLAPLSKQLPDGMVGRDAIEFADRAASEPYQTLLPKLTLQADHQFVQNSGDILSRINELPPDRAAQVQNIIKNSLLSKFDEAGRMSGTAFQAGDEKLGQMARMYSSSADPEQRAMGGIFRDVQGEFRDLLDRSNPQYAGELRPIRQAFANLVRIEAAAGSAGAKGGVFTPSQLGNSVRRFDTSARKKNYAMGKALLQDISDPAQEVLPPTLPDSGTAYRSILAYALGAGVGATAKAAAPAAIPLALYTKAGSKAFQKIMLAPRTPAEKALAKALTQLKAPFAVAGGGAAAQAANGY